MAMKVDRFIAVRALRTIQKEGIETFSFFLPGARIIEVADISRLSRDSGNQLKGFQRKEIRNHIRSIVEYLDQGGVLFPNAIIMALAPDVSFKQSRGPSPEHIEKTAVAGTLHIPLKDEGHRVAWIVDGQQRSLALAQSKNKLLSVPIIGFVCTDIELQREQFILVNKAKPLPSRLINELLPEVNTLLPRDLSLRKLPSELCNQLNLDPRSPFHKLIKRASNTNDNAVVTDTALEKAIQRNLRPPMGALNQYKGMGSEPSNTDAMYDTLLRYWATVRDVFDEAWGLSPNNSRLMHSAGIRSMGGLMDQILLRADGQAKPWDEVREALQRIQPFCCWTEGVWDGLGWPWNEVQSTTSHISKLTDYLSRLDRDLTRKKL